MGAKMTAAALQQMLLPARFDGIVGDFDSVITRVARGHVAEDNTVFHDHSAQPTPEAAPLETTVYRGDKPGGVEQFLDDFLDTREGPPR
jgi:hypothetical protein